MLLFPNPIDTKPKKVPTGNAESPGSCWHSCNLWNNIKILTINRNCLAIKGFSSSMGPTLFWLLNIDDRVVSNSDGRFSKSCQCIINICFACNR